MSEMTGWNMKTLLNALGEEVLEVHGNSGVVFGEISTDSRRITKNCIFIAIRGENFDGHDFVAQAAQAGAGVAVVEELQDTGCTQILVRDSIEAYGRLAAAWRAQFSIPLICVAGSNGKTTTTQMIASILRTACGEEAIAATKGNFNNHIGVPQMLLTINARTKAAVIEAGMNHPGEMARLVSWIRPTVVVLTNAQREHQEFLHTVEASARENAFALVSLSAKGTAVLPLKDPSVGIWRDFVRARGCRMMTYAAGDDAAANVTVCADEGAIAIKKGAESFSSVLNLVGEHALHDAAAAAAASFAIGVKPEAIARGLADFKPVRGRGVRHVLRNGAILIDDAYNANPDSMRAAIDVLAQLPGPRVLIAGDMAETGDNAARFHEEVCSYAKERGVDRLLAVGEHMREAVGAFGSGARWFAGVDELTHAAKVAAQTPGSMLVKASHSMHLEAVVDAVAAAMTARTA